MRRERVVGSRLLLLLLYKSRELGVATKLVPQLSLLQSMGFLLTSLLTLRLQRAIKQLSGEFHASALSLLLEMAKQRKPLFHHFTIFDQRFLCFEAGAEQE